VRFVLLVSACCIALSGCVREGPRPEASASAAAEAVAPEPVPLPEPAAPEFVPPPEAAKECLPGKKQSGTGCDMEGIMAAVRPLREAGGPVQACYLAHVRPPVAGKVLLQFHLAAAGRAEGFGAAKDDFSSPGLVECLGTALAGVSFPAPGDVPCKVVYPFTFVPGAPHGR
jgi:hypothetical protein